HEIDELCTTAGDQDAAEDEQYGTQWRGDEVPDELRHKRQRLKRMEQAKARLEAEQRAVDDARGRTPDDRRKPPRGGSLYKRAYGVPDDRAQTNFTDPESRIMVTSKGFEQCYNGQLAVDGDFQMIVANELSNNGSDRGQLLPVLQQ